MAGRKEMDLRTQSRKQILRQLYRNRWLYGMLLLPVLYFIIFKFGPIYGLQIAFRNFRVRKGIWGSDWVGLKYFQQYMADPEFWKLVRNTIFLGIGQVCFVFPWPIIFALLLNEVKSKTAQRFIQNISYLPHFISVVVVASMLTTFLAKDGIINQLIVLLGGEAHIFMQDPAWFRPLYWMSNLWQELGWSAIIYYAALTGVDSNLYEAAVIDGANRWQQTIHVTLPAIKPTISIMLIMAVGGIMNSNTDLILLLYTSATYETADVIGTYIYRVGIQGGKFSQTAAIGLFATIINFFLVFAANQLSNKISGTGLW